MEYGEAISPEAFDRAIAIGCALLHERDAPLQLIAAIAVSRAYCVCVTVGEDAAERRMSDVHRRLIDSVAERLSHEAMQEAGRRRSD